MEQIDQREKTLVFCATQDHALAVRDLINQMKTSNDPNYCQRVTANDGALGEQHLRDFQDNEKTIPTILTTSQKLSTGVDARNIRNIVLMRPINSMIEFKQIIGRGTRLYDGKDYFTIYDFVKAYQHFNDPEWDGEPLEPEPPKPRRPRREARADPTPEPRDEPPSRAGEDQDQAGRRQGAHHPAHDGDDLLEPRRHADVGRSSSWKALFGKLPEFFKDEAELRKLWSDPDTRKKLLEGLAEGASRAVPAHRDPQGHRCREERPVRRARPRRVRRPPDARRARDEAPFDHSQRGRRSPATVPGVRTFTICVRRRRRARS